MCKNDVLVLTLDSTAFSKMKEDFNSILKKTLGNMQIKESREATLTLKLNISLTDAEAPDFSVPYENAMRNIKKPRFDHKISSVMQIKNYESGSLKGEYELVWDDELQDWIMKPIDNGQQTIFDFVDADYEDVTENGSGEAVAGLPAPKPLLADGTASNGNEEPYSDYEYEDGGSDE